MHGDQNHKHQSALGPDGLVYNQQTVEIQKVHLDKESLAKMEKIVQHHLQNFQIKMEKYIFDPQAINEYSEQFQTRKATQYIMSHKETYVAPNKILPDHF